MMMPTNTVPAVVFLPRDIFAANVAPVRARHAVPASNNDDQFYSLSPTFTRFFHASRSCPTK